ncbi:hypothetical protein HYH03_009101 [Edaphochlamys debaryana]|uniref:AB hydrolase-1 domain-containing protein n=1 Tax=Edaphochlamys debaryana TaxID=47281 RepID=A0A836BY70_9CHLO|nr:hypothetical protein HYH03_009101 [Edaphochlamys debaryana]|eukprot:KAG2492687.1 hypothetical protein HYH03_009101 [Edaphochlamys debaryana]
MALAASLSARGRSGLASQLLSGSLGLAAASSPAALASHVQLISSPSRSLGQLAFEEVIAGTPTRQHPTAPPERTIFILHGLLGCGRNWRTWARRLVEAAAAAHPDAGGKGSLGSGGPWRAVLVDLRCHGGSARRSGFHPPHNMRAAAEDVGRLIRDQLGHAAPAAVLGHSLGGKVGLALLGLAAEGAAACAPPRQLWVLDSQPGLVPADLDAGTGVSRVLQTVHTIPLPITSRSALLAQLRERGLSDALATWLASNLVQVPGDSRHRPTSVPVAVHAEAINPAFASSLTEASLANVFRHKAPGAATTGQAPAGLAAGPGAGASARGGQTWPPRPTHQTSLHEQPSAQDPEPGFATSLTEASLSGLMIKGAAAPAVPSTPAAAAEPAARGGQTWPPRPPQHKISLHEQPSAPEQDPDSGFATSLTEASLSGLLSKGAAAGGAKVQQDSTAPQAEAQHGSQHAKHGSSGSKHAGSHESSHKSGSGSTHSLHGPLTWSFDIQGASAMYMSYRTTEFWALLERPPHGVAVHLVQGARSDRWPDSLQQRLLAAAARSTAGAEGAAGHGQGFGTFDHHVLERAGHWLHVDNPEGLLKLVLASME